MKSRYQPILFGTLLLMCAGTWGCQRSNAPQLFKVSGVITLEEQPLANAMVTFIPQKGLPAVGLTDQAGRYQIMTSGRSGAATGEYQIAVVSGEAVDQPEAKSYEEMSPAERKKLSKSTIPARYGDPLTSQLQAVIENSARDDVNFDLKK